MKEFLRTILSNPRLWQVLLASVLGFFGIAEYNKATVEIVHEEPIIQQEHKHKNWLPIIQSEDRKSRREHNDNHHGGN